MGAEESEGQSGSLYPSVMKTYAILVPKRAIPDPEALRRCADDNLAEVELGLTLLCKRRAIPVPCLSSSSGSRVWQHLTSLLQRKH
jgi:hypothetical protein